MGKKKTKIGLTEFKQFAQDRINGFIKRWLNENANKCLLSLCAAEGVGCGVPPSSAFSAPWSPPPTPQPPLTSSGPRPWARLTVAGAGGSGMRSARAAELSGFLGNRHDAVAPLV